MDRQCLKFRDFFLQKELNDEINPEQQLHLDECPDCRKFANTAKDALSFLQKEKTIEVPGRVEDKLDWQLFRPKAVFRPALVFTMMIIFFFSSVFFIKNFYPLESDQNPNLLNVEMVHVNGMSVDIFLDQNDKYVNIFIPYNGD